MKVTLIVGGRGGEHAISLQSGGAVAGALKRLGFDYQTLTLTRDGRASVDGVTCEMTDAWAQMVAFAPDCAFIATHGEDGEDGRIQGLLEVLGIPYQGSGVRSSALAMEKSTAKLHYSHHGLPVAKDVVLHTGDTPVWTEIEAELGLPLVLKTATSGSSVGIEVIDTSEDLKERGRALFASTPTLLIEQWLPGREFTVSVVEDASGVPIALPVVEICPINARFFDYEAKYTPGATDEICPAPIDDIFARELQALGLEAHRILGCRHISRTDFKCDAHERPFLLETNTLPGLTPMSLLPKAAEAAGIHFDEVINGLIDAARRAGTRR